MSISISHNPSENRFEYRTNDDVAICEYTMVGDVWHFHHTVVPESMRGQGVAARLVEAALNHVETQDGKIVPKCSYVASYIKKNPDFAHLVAPE